MSQPTPAPPNPGRTGRFPSDNEFRWQAASVRPSADEGVRAGGIYDVRHHVVVSFEDFDQRALRVWLSARVQAVEATTWAEIGARLGQLGHWAFEDYRD
jgi:hypothetical protein